MSDDGELKEDLIENRALELQLESKAFEEYRCSAVVIFPTLCETALAVLFPFVTTCTCESAFRELYCQLRRNLEIG